jgi:hypothetical protein
MVAGPLAAALRLSVAAMAVVAATAVAPGAAAT